MLKELDFKGNHIYLLRGLYYLDVKSDIELLKIPFHHSSSPFHCLYTPLLFDK